MTEALIERIDQLTKAVTLMAQQQGARLTSAQVCERIGRTRQTITSMVRRGDFPEPCKDGRWLLADILEWEAEKTH
jgi:predicted DNA-binding transcriptional regulator AlpA